MVYQIYQIYGVASSDTATHPPPPHTHTHLHLPDLPICIPNMTIMRYLSPWIITMV